MKENEGPWVSSEEIRFIRENTQRSPYCILGFLSSMREEGKTLTEVHQDAVSQPHQEEHHPSYRRARDFLKQHADRFGIEVGEEDD